MSSYVIPLNKSHAEEENTTSKGGQPFTDMAQFKKWWDHDSSLGQRTSLWDAAGLESTTDVIAHNMPVVWCFNFGFRLLSEDERSRLFSAYNEAVSKH